ncbi:hypothetical protein CLV84_1409 [Neolewinella xylanilytica]|uniref:Uncharacterized protein n=1 Tax=Neolewinella xylanilytica TaxID=1514080 RepID=A0A2S6IAD9_9BACT|nr:hypothetical protein [Neolewinella xylanilytica]PPK88442.1 hypothetical protein CLV84_1409 [Neolewinella xylanilytica]
MNLLSRVFFLCLLFGAASQLPAQCNFKAYQEFSAAKMPDTHRLLKSYHLDGKGGEQKQVEVKLNLRKDTNYHFQLATGADGGAEGVVAAVLNNKDNEVASSYDHTGYREQFNYRCRDSGVYTIVFTFKEAEIYCGAATVSVEK